MLHNTVAYLESLGSIVDVIEKKDKIVIKGYGCPVAGAVSADGRFCAAVAVMIGDLVELPTVERCEREPQPDVASRYASDSASDLLKSAI
jgi:hypothetical protein